MELPSKAADAWMSVIGPHETCTRSRALPGEQVYEFPHQA
jgi:hypothetical protein